MGYGTEFFGLYTLITIGIGLSVMLREMLTRGLVPELGMHLENGIPKVKSFVQAYASSFVVSGSFVLIGISLMVILGVLLLPSEADSSLARAGYIFLGFRILTMCFAIGFAPMLNLLIIMQRQVQSNFLKFAERLVELIAFLTPIALFPQISHSDQLIYFGFFAFIGTVLIYLIAGFFITRIHEDFVPSLVNRQKAQIIKIYKTMGWGAIYVISMNAHVRLNVIFAKLFFGALGVTIFGIAVQLMGYTRQLAVGLIVGLDAVFASLTNSDRSTKLIKTQVLSGTSAIQAILLFNVVGVLIFLHVEILDLWIGDVIKNPEQNLAIIAKLSMLMVVGISLRSLNLGWMSAMTGSGQISKFAGWLIIPALLNPTLVYLFFWIFGDDFSIIHFGWIFVILQFLAHGLIIPYLTSRVMKVSILHLLKPFLNPFIYAILACVLCFIYLNSFIELSTLFKFLLVLFFFALSGLLSLGTLYWNLSKIRRINDNEM